jgi:hypothetical protein
MYLYVMRQLKNSHATHYTGDMDPEIKALVEEARIQLPLEVLMPSLFEPKTTEERERRLAIFKGALGSLTDEEADAMRRSVEEGRA